MRQFIATCHKKRKFVGETFGISEILCNFAQHSWNAEILEQNYYHITTITYSK